MPSFALHLRLTFPELPAGLTSIVINLNPPPAPLMPDELAVPETPQGHAQPKGDTAADTAADTPEWLQAATADLGAASGGSSWLAVGANVLYRSAGGTLEHATVRAVHSDDLTAPCYTIEFDGTERRVD